MHGGLEWKAFPNVYWFLWCRHSIIRKWEVGGVASDQYNSERSLEGKQAISCWFRTVWKDSEQQKLAHFWRAQKCRQFVRPACDFFLICDKNIVFARVCNFAKIVSWRKGDLFCLKNWWKEFVFRPTLGKKKLTRVKLEEMKLWFRKIQNCSDI